MVKIIQLVDDLSNKNFGVWNASIVCTDQLKANGFTTLLYCLKYRDNKLFSSEKELIRDSVSEVKSLALLTFIRYLWVNKKHKRNIIIVSNGCWKAPSIAGFASSIIGYRWIAVPQGMLEEWSMRQKALKKKLYFRLIEKNILKFAGSIRAVSKPEEKELAKYFEKIVLIPNSVRMADIDTGRNLSQENKVLFLSRLHKKKRVYEMIVAWSKSKLANNPLFNLIIAGPDDGELSKINSFLSNNYLQNIQLLGPVYGDAKNELYKNCSFYFLPSLSEGMPTALLEAMSYGLVCFATRFCNIPDAFDNKAAILLNDNLDDLVNRLDDILVYKSDYLREYRRCAINFVKENYSENIISKKLMTFYSGNV